MDNRGWINNSVLVDNGGWMDNGYMMWIGRITVAWMIVNE